MYHLSSMITSLTGHDYEYLYTYVLKDTYQSVDDRIGSVFIMIGNALWLLLYMFILFGLFFKRHRQWKVFLVVFIVWNSVLVALAGGSWGGRYNLSVAPIMFLLASDGIYAWFGTMKRFYVQYKWF